ncbi:MAG TPA: VTT domain-containing protein [Bryobacteraceae bacterium]|nr:VTT domain-containing protein [Bryobacteraceae bacterium]
MRELILAAVSQYGLPAVFAVTVVAAIGVPLPVTLLLIVAGSLAAQGVMPLGWAISLASAGAVAGDQIGYAIGRWGGHALVSRFVKLLGGPQRIAQAQAQARRWGGLGVFLSRWLLTPLGSVVNFASGIASYSWLHFAIWDVLGETLGAVLYIGLGRAFSDRVLALGDLMSNITWAVAALLAALGLGWKLWRARTTGSRSPR